MEIVAGRTEVSDVGSFVETLDDIAASHGVVVQAFDVQYVVDRTHLRRAVDLAARARDRGEAIADDAGVEMLLYAAGRRQINRALESGVSAGERAVVAVAVDLSAHDWTAESAEATADEQAATADIVDALDDPDASVVGEYDPESVRSYFDVTDRELDATRGDLADIVHERVALLVVER